MRSSRDKLDYPYAAVEYWILIICKTISINVLFIVIFGEFAHFLYWMAWKISTHNTIKGFNTTIANIFTLVLLKLCFIPQKIKHTYYKSYLLDTSFIKYDKSHVLDL